ncbi:uncharacterized protein LOC136095231 [Hydra vulgaris]|uniref:uncharacterized protein LOC136095231 n=1 Tax=Hydra vulgaris TaxID=6087 RepID=UPI0032E9F445
MRKADLIRAVEQATPILDRPIRSNITQNTLTPTQYIPKSMASFQRTKSNWRFVSVVEMNINFIEYKPIKGKSYIPLPKELAAKIAIINMKNEDNECFKWCVARFFNTKEKNSERVDKDLKEQSEKLNWEKIEFPVSLQQITQFEKNNQDISVNVFAYERFSTEKSLTKHKLYCDTHDSVRIERPKPNKMIKFKNYNKSMRVPFVVYADFESFIKPINTCSPNPNDFYTKQYQKHTPSSFCSYIKCFDEKIYQSKLVTFTASNEDEDVAQKLVDTLEEDVKKIYNDYLKFPKKMIFTSKDKNNFDNAKICHICEKDLKEDRVRDHSHITGKYRGAAHSDCNLQLKNPKFIPVLFHNLSDNDSHLFIKKLSEGGKINCIPNNEEKYISFSKELKVNELTNKEGKQVEVKLQLRFLDSFKFMAASLDSLTKNLSKDQCKNISRYYSGNELNLLLRKESFYSRLNDEGISDEDYLHAQTVWKEFDCETFRDYHNLYNESDVLLLADVYENFRDVCFNNYKLDPAWYYTAQGLAWDAALKITKVKLKLLSNYDMILMIKQGIRGGISMVPNWLGTANNKYM